MKWLDVRRADPAERLWHSPVGLCSGPMPPDLTTLLRRVRELVDRHRVTCLWYLRPDYQPETVADALRILDAIATNGDLKTFQEAEEVRRWLSRASSSPSVA